MIKKYLKYIVLIVLLLVFLIFGYSYSRTKLTYLEYKSVNESEDCIIPVEEAGYELRQEFVMPYEVFDSVAVEIGTYARDNNSNWHFVLYDPNGQVLYEGSFNASLFSDNEYFRYEIGKRLLVNKGDIYSFTLSSDDVSVGSSLAFYASDDDVEGASLSVDGEETEGALCFRIYGGDRDNWWCGFTILLFVYAFSIVARLIYLEYRGKRIRDDKLLIGLLVGAVVFALLYSYAISGKFTDENDNIRGGMLIADGGVLYRDYVAQHTPLVYYLCSVFALLGAGSIEQFRLSYYFFECLIWLFLFVRHADFYGKRRMVILAVLESIIISSVVTPAGYMILSDGFQGILFTMLLLEFIRYYNDHRLGIDRCIIISACIWGSIGSAFVSIFALFFLAILFVVVEVLFLSKNKIKLVALLSRYGFLIISLLIPPIVAVSYFKYNNAWEIAYRQFYTFNREVYPKYLAGLGERMYQPFVDAVKFFFNIISTCFNRIVTSEATNVDILQLVLMTVAVIVIIKLFEQKKIIEALALGLMMVFSATRDYGPHGLAAWYIAVLIIVLHIDLLMNSLRMIGKPLLGVFLILLTSTYFIAVSRNIMYKQPSISEIEYRVIEMTEQDEDRRIFIDAYSNDYIYWLYKGRTPVNPAVYMLPWYMDWYEQENIDALVSEMPHIVVYDEDRITWSYDHYTNTFDEVLRSNYTRLGDEGWQHSIWVRTDSLDENT